MPICLVAGKETFLKNQFVDAKLKSSYTVRRINALGRSESDVLSELNQESLFDSDVAYVINDVDTIKGAKTKFMKWLKSISDIRLVFLLISKSSWELSKAKTKFYDDVKGMGSFVCFNMLKGKELITWVKTMFMAYKKHISDDNAYYFVSLMDTNLCMMSNEIYKLSYACDGDFVDLPTIKAIALYSKKLDINHLLESIARRDKTIALFSVLKMLTEREPLYVLSILRSEFDRIVKVKALVEKRVPDSEISKETGIPSYKIKEYVNLSHKYEKLQIKTLYQKLPFMDFKLKDGGNPQYLFENWVLEACQ